MVLEIISAAPASTAAADPFDAEFGVQECIKGSCSFTLDEWVEMASRCEYLPENDVHELCNMVSSVKGFRIRIMVYFRWYSSSSTFKTSTFRSVFEH